jgi:tetratricopeptide (TPR) repeat protein
MKHFPKPAVRQPGPPFSPNPTAAIPVLARRALEFHQSGHLAEAEGLYRRILLLDPQHTDSLHLLGVLAHQVGQNAVAVALIGQAIAIDPHQAAYHCNLGTALQALRRADEAESSYRQALKLQPSFAQAQMNLGTVMQAQGQLEEAEACFRRALALCPDLAEIHINLGNILLARGRLDEAAASHERALALRPESAAVLYNLANTRLAQGRLDEAATGYRRALHHDPDLAAAHGNLGNTLLAQDKAEEAAACYENALALQPDNSEFRYNLGNARQAQKRFDEALVCYRRAIELQPALAQAHYNLGNTLHTLGRMEEAKAAFAEALRLEPRYAEAHYNLGCVLQELGRPQEALSRIALALEIKHDYPQARFALALAQVQAGDFTAGWRGYDSRWNSADHDTPWRPYSQPLWKGEKLAEGRLLLWGEQGIGDEIQFAGLIPDALRSGNRIVLDCAPRLQPLFARSFPGIEVVSGFGPEEAEGAEIAAQLPTGSLPGLFRNSEEEFVTTISPYLKADPEKTEAFRAQYGGGGPLIGLTWRTANTKSGSKRCIDLAELAPLFALSGLRWISLQYGACDDLEAQARTAKVPLLIDRSVDQFADIDRFAAQVAAMDLVITIDNSTAHLAGALGRPTWLMLPLAADWRWLLERADSPWYPTLRLLRQTGRGDWRSVFDPVRLALADLLAEPNAR